MMRMGVDVGGTKIEIIALNEAGHELFRKRVSTPRDYQGTLTAIVELVDEVESSVGEKGSVGLGIPGTISPFSGLVKNANAIWINGKALDVDLGKRLNREVRVANDANCFALSEAVDGAAAGKSLVFGVIIGTGCGAGVVIDGKVHAGGNGIGGEWGHNPLPWMLSEEFNSTQCFCGNHDCIETFISGTGFIRDYNEALTAAANPRAAVKSSLDIMALVAANDDIASAAFNRYVDRVARSLAHAINMLDPDIIVLGGGMSNVEAIYPRLPALLTRYVLGGECHTQVVLNKHGGSSGVRGAAWLWGK